MASKMSPSTVGDAERVSDSVQPVHSWNDSQMTDGRRAFSIASAIRGIMLGGNASIDAVVAQYLRKPRRETPFARNTSPTVGVLFMLFSSRKNWLLELILQTSATGNDVGVL
jgi:hypothetical protein